jgi:antitoxin CcdA
MRMENPMSVVVERNKKATNLSIRADLLEAARELDINLSSEFERHLSEVVKKKLGEKWLEENRAAIDDYNRYVERNGIWSDGLRMF